LCSRGLRLLAADRRVAQAALDLDVEPAAVEVARLLDAVLESRLLDALLERVRAPGRNLQPGGALITDGGAP